MFKNPLKYQQGGQLNQEQQQMLAAFIDWLPKRVKEFEGMQPEAIVQALDGMSKTPEGQRQVQAYVEQFQSEMNGVASRKLGGKIQDFICKHAKGGHVGCGCKEDGGVVKAQGGHPALGLNFIQREYDGDGNAVYFLAPEQRFLPANMRQDPNSNYQKQGSEYQGDGQISIVDFGNGKLRIQKDPYGPFGEVAHGADSAAYANRALELMRKIGMKPSSGFVQSKQDGGEISRREALRLGRENKGFNRSQARFAYQNAKNTLRNAGASGREMRQTARQWVAGQTEQPTQAVILSAPASVDQSLTAARPMNYPTEHNESLANLPFNEAFGRARRAGAQTFWWPRGQYKIYNTQLGTKSNGNERRELPGTTAEPGSTIIAPELPVIDTNFEVPNIVIDEASLPQVTLNLTDTTPTVNIPGIPEPIVQVAQPVTTTAETQPTTESDFVAEYLRTHFPNGARRNFISRNIYGQQRNLIGETSPLFIGPPKPGTVQSREKGGKVEKGQFGMSIINPKLVNMANEKINYWLDYPRNKWNQDHTESKMIGGAGPAALIAPFEVRIPTEAFIDQRGAALIKNLYEEEKAAEAATKAGEFYNRKSWPNDFDIDKFPTFNEDIIKKNLYKYIKNTKFTK